MAERPQPPREEFDLRGFAAAFRAFKGDKQTFRHNFFNLNPFGESSMTQPLDFNSSRMASERLKSFDFFAAIRSSASAEISAGISVSDFVPMPRTESILFHSISAISAAVGLKECSARRRFSSLIHSNTAPHAPEMFKSSSRAAVNDGNKLTVEFCTGFLSSDSMSAARSRNFP